MTRSSATTAGYSDLDEDTPISDILASLGVTHCRDGYSTTDSAHSLYYAGRFIGRYNAHDVGALIRDHNEAARSALAQLVAGQR